MFVAIVGISIAGVLVVYNQAIKGSADPLVRKQAIAVAESLLGEVLMQPITWCDPQDAANDPNNPPTSGASCTGGVAASQDKNGGTLGPLPATESRFSATDPFDNVADYNGYSMSSGIYSLDNGTTPVAGLGSYSATVTVTKGSTSSCSAVTASAMADSSSAGMRPSALIWRLSMGRRMRPSAPTRTVRVSSGAS